MPQIFLGALVPLVFLAVYRLLPVVSQKHPPRFFLLPAAVSCVALSQVYAMVFGMGVYHTLFESIFISAVLVAMHWNDKPRSE